MKIKYIRVYQAVKLDGRVDTFFSTEKSATNAATSIEILPDLGVLLKRTEHVIVPFSNISGIYLLTEAEEVKKAEEAAKEAAIDAAKSPFIPKRIKVDPVRK